MSYGFVAYIDESGDDGLKRVRPLHSDGSSEWLVLAATVIRASNESAVGHWQKDILRKCGLTQRKDIHFRDLSDAKKAIACYEIGAAPVRCFVIMSNKKNMLNYRNPRTYPEKNFLYWWLTRLLLERVSKFCSTWSRVHHGGPLPIKFVFSLRGDLHYDRLLSYLGLLKFQSETGHLYLNAGDLSWDVVDLKQIEVLPHVSEAGLQLADVVAGAFHAAVCLDGKSPCKIDYALSLVSRLYRGPSKQILDYGVKPMPQLRRMNLHSSQRRIFERLGFPRNRW